MDQLKGQVTAIVLHPYANKISAPRKRETLSRHSDLLLLCNMQNTSGSSSAHYLHVQLVSCCIICLSSVHFLLHNVLIPLPTASEAKTEEYMVGYGWPTK